MRVSHEGGSRIPSLYPSLALLTLYITGEGFQGFPSAAKQNCFIKYLNGYVLQLTRI